MGLSINQAFQQVNAGAARQSGSVDPVAQNLNPAPVATAAPVAATPAVAPAPPAATGMLGAPAAPAPSAAPAPVPSQPMGGQVAATSNPSLSTSTSAGTGTFTTQPGNYDAVDPKLGTVQGQLAGMMQGDSPVMRQASDRQLMAFNGRGLLNTSMAQQAAQEAAIAAGTPIATADAGIYNDARKQVQQNNFQVGQTLQSQDATTRQNYQTAVQSVSTNFQKMVDTINASNMTPEDKNVAMQQATLARDGELVYTNNLYASMPRWQSQWSAAATPVGGTDLNTVTNRDTLANIANDPAQSAETRAAAAARLGQVPTAAAAPPPNVRVAPDDYSTHPDNGFGY